MKDKRNQNGQQMPEKEFSEFGDVRVIYRPGPDAEDRLRRLFTILLRTSAGEWQVGSEKNLPPDDQHVDDRIEAET